MSVGLRLRTESRADESPATPRRNLRRDARLRSAMERGTNKFFGGIRRLRTLLLGSVGLASLLANGHSTDVSTALSALEALGMRPFPS